MYWLGTGWTHGQFEKQYLLYAQLACSICDDNKILMHPQQSREWGVMLSTVPPHFSLIYFKVIKKIIRLNSQLSVVINYVTTLELQQL